MFLFLGEIKETVIAEVCNTWGNADTISMQGNQILGLNVSDLKL